MLTQDEVILDQVPAGAAPSEEAMKEQARQNAGRMVLLFAGLANSAPEELQDDIAELGNAYQRAVRADNPNEARALKDSEAAQNIDAYTRPTCGIRTG